MRRHRPTHYSLAFLTVALGIAAVPAARQRRRRHRSRRAGRRRDDTAAARRADARARPTSRQPAPRRRDRRRRPRRTDDGTDGGPASRRRRRPTEPAAPAPGRRRRPPRRIRRRRRPDGATDARRPPRRRRRASRRRRPSSRRPCRRPPMTTSSTPTLPTHSPTSAIVRPIAFPVLGAVRYGNDWGNCRDGCARRHQGTDMIGVRMQPLLAAVDGTVTRIRYENVGTAGTVISITGADGWYYNYFHVNNDTPGTDDGLAGHEWQISPHLTVGSTRASRSGDRLHGRQRQRRRLGAAPPLRDPPTRPHAGQPVPQPRRGPAARDVPAARWR